MILATWKNRRNITSTSQGLSVFSYSSLHLLQRLDGVGAEGPQLGSPVRDAQDLKDVDHGVSQGREDHWGGSRSDAAGVFPQRLVADVEHPVLDPLVLAGDRQQPRGVRLLAAQRRDAEDRLGGR